MIKMHGVTMVMATPFKADQSIDFDGVKHNIERYIEAGVHAVMVAGALGEYLTMTLDERKELTAFVAKAINGRIPFLVGTTAHRTSQVIELTNHAGEHGAIGVMILPPPGTGLLDDEIFNFYKEVTANINVPVMLYNNPGSSGMDMQHDMIARLVELPHVEAIKEASGDVKRITRMTAEFPNLTVFCGWEDMHHESFLAGAKGWVCMGANFAPIMTRSLFELVENGNLEDARNLTYTYNPLARYMENAGKITQTVKYIMDKNGLVGGFVREPRSPLTEQEKAAIDAILAEVKPY